LKLLASPDRLAKSSLCSEWLTIEAVTSVPSKVWILFWHLPGGSISLSEWVNDIVTAGAVMIDNSSAFRMDAEVPLFVPEVNPVIP
jgi:aspartate-semialdehyde dehydrogenase